MPTPISRKPRPYAPKPRNLEALRPHASSLPPRTRLAENLRPPDVLADGRRGQGGRLREADLQRARLRAPSGGGGRARRGAAPRQPLPRHPRLPPQGGHSRVEPGDGDLQRPRRKRVERGAAERAAAPACRRRGRLPLALVQPLPHALRRPRDGGATRPSDGDGRGSCRHPGRRHPLGRDGPDAGRDPVQPQQPERGLPPAGRGAPFGGGPAGARAPDPGRGRVRRLPRARPGEGERRRGPHVLEGPRAGGPQVRVRHSLRQDLGLRREGPLPGLREPGGPGRGHGLDAGRRESEGTRPLRRWGTREAAAGLRRGRPGLPPLAGELRDGQVRGRGVRENRHPRQGGRRPGLPRVEQGDDRQRGGERPGRRGRRGLGPQRREGRLNRTLGIVGVGLIGGSVGLAARSLGWEVVGVDRPEVLGEAEELGAVDRASTLKEVREVDLVVLAAPISKVTALLSELAPTDALVTDVASAKGAIVRAAERENLRFVGGHPMAGSQLAGVAHAKAGLFHGARYFLTTTERTDPDDYREVSGFVRTLGAVPTAVDPEKHDLLMAALSHLPHLMAAALLKVASDISPEALSFAGPSFRDLTRVGASNPSLWSDILAENAPGVFAEVTTLMGSNNINILDLYVRHSNTERAALVLTLNSDAAPLARDLLREAGFGAEIQG